MYLGNKYLALVNSYYKLTMEQIFVRLSLHFLVGVFVLAK
jgi:hypothetical protein